MNQEIPSSEELRRVARFLEEDTLAVVESYSDIHFPLTTTPDSFFPRERPEDRAAEQGFAVLQQTIEQAIATLDALAAARDHDRPVPLVLMASVRPYIEAFRAGLKAEEKGASSNANYGSAQ